MINFRDEEKEYLSKIFTDLDLPGHTFYTTIFEECLFKNCNFNEAEFIDCEFIECHFLNCNLSVVRLTNCKLNDLIFTDCKIIGVDWTAVNWPSVAIFSPIKFTKCVLDHSTFFGISLNEIAIEACQAHDVDFRNGSFCDANFTLTDFSGSLFNDTDLSGSDFTDAYNYRIDIHYNKIKGAKFSRFEAVSLLEGLGIELID